MPDRFAAGTVSKYNRSHRISFRSRSMSNDAIQNAAIAAFAAVAYILAALTGPLIAQAADDTYVRINQLGYRPSEVKIAVAMARAALQAKFQVVEAASQKVVFENEARAIDGRWGKFDHHAHLDLSKLNKEGEYFVRFAGTKSPTFQIAASVYAELPDQLLEFM